MTYETYMLQLILQILVLFCSFLDQHGDPPGSCHLLTLPKLCAVVFSLQTHQECVVVEHPWFDLQCNHYDLVNDTWDLFRVMTSVADSGGMRPHTLSYRLDWMLDLSLLTCNFFIFGHRLHWVHTQHAMHPCIQTYTTHPAAGARHFTHHHCHARAFLFHSQTAKDTVSRQWEMNDYTTLSQCWVMMAL